MELQAKLESIFQNLPYENKIKEFWIVQDYPSPKRRSPREVPLQKETYYLNARNPDFLSPLKRWQEQKQITKEIYADQDDFYQYQKEQGKDRTIHRLTYCVCQQTYEEGKLMIQCEGTCLE